MICQMKKQTIILAVTGLAVAFTAGGLAWRESSRAAPRANQTLNKPATPGVSKAEAARALFTSAWPDLKGQSVAMQSYLGKPIVVNFWATWCVPCVEEMPALDAMARAMPEVQFVGIGVDTDKNIMEFLAKIPVTYPLLVAGHSAISTVQQLGNPAGGLPFTVLVDAQGNVIETILGQVKLDDLRDKIHGLIRN